MDSKKIYTTKSGVNIDWPFFTDEEKKQLGRNLKKYDSEKVKRFISSLQIYCQLFPLTRSAPNRTDQRAELIAMKKDLETAENHLKRLVTCQTRLQHLRLMSDLMSGKNPLSGTNTAMDAAGEALPHIEKINTLIDNQLENEKRQKGRPRSVTTDFVSGIAELFKRHLAKPTITRFGAFEEICNVAIEAVNLPVIDPTRAIRNAVKNLV